MTEPDLSAQLETLVNAMANSARLLYRAHSLEFKLTALAILTYLAYRVGRSTVTDPLDNNVKDLSKAIKDRQHYLISLPQKMKNLARIRKIFFFGFIILTTAVGAIFYFKHQLIKKRTLYELYGGAGTLVLLFSGSICLWIYEVIIAFAIKRGGFNDHAIQQKLAGIVDTLGKKTELLIKTHLCRQKYLSRRRGPSTLQCSKNKCKEYRILLKQKADDISRMVDNVLNFEWCSICRKKIPFDEFLCFERRFYNKNEQLSEQKQVSERNEYLLSELQRMQRWVQQTSPCNCSKRYWIDSTREIRQFKKQEKAVSQQLILYEPVKAK